MGGNGDPASRGIAIRRTAPPRKETDPTDVIIPAQAGIHLCHGHRLSPL
jgi:hypothetical protein